MRFDSYGPALGVECRDFGARFTLWTSAARQCAVRVALGRAPARDYELAPRGEGIFSADVEGVGHGARYDFVLDGKAVRDPYARFLPDGIDAPASIWAAPFGWKHDPVSRPLREHAIYELHIGTFTRVGTYAAAARQLPLLADLGVTALELMPIAAFAGQRGWGYDGVAHYAPFAPYGSPNDLRAFIDAAHGLGLAVLLDVVYNHLGPAGNVLSQYGREYFSSAEQTAWGEAPNFGHAAMRRYVSRNVRYWLEEFRFDGLRLDAVHAIVDHSRYHILREIADEAAKLSPKRILIAEDDRNDPQIVSAQGFDGVWADDFHHQLHVACTREQDGYYAAYSGNPRHVAKTIEQGWFYSGATYPPTGKSRGKPAAALPAESFVYCTQNHDQVGNRAFGDRLNMLTFPEAFAASTLLLLFLPMTPLLFMGQEWAASTPFLYFTDHAEELGRLITQGRRKEFAHFAAFNGPAGAREIPDPQALSAFEASRLVWAERSDPQRQPILALHRQMLKLRATDPVLRAAPREQLTARSEGALLIVERWLANDTRRLLVNLGTARCDAYADPALGEVIPSVLVATGGAKWGKPLPPFSGLLSAHVRQDADRDR